MPYSNDDDFFLFDFDEMFKKIEKKVIKQQAVYQFEKRATSYSIPPPKRSDAKWLLPGEKITIGEYNIESGFFYVGTYFPSRWSDKEPSLVNPDLRLLDRKENEDYFYSGYRDYALLWPCERREYLSWLSDNRQRADTSNTPPLIFLSGLERRILDDSKNKTLTDKEEIAIRDEVFRIMLLYKGNLSVEIPYSNFFQYLGLKINDRRLYAIPFPAFSVPQYDYFYRDIPAYIKVALTQTALDGVPVPADIAFEWFRQESDFNKYAPFDNLPNEFKTLFKIRYKQKFGLGLFLKPNKKLIHSYRNEKYKPITTAISKNFDFKIAKNLCDVSTLPSAKKKINDLGMLVNAELDKYSRRLSRKTYIPNPNLDFLILPVELWNKQAFEKLEKLKTDVQNKCIIIDALSLFKHFTGSSELSKTPFFDLAFTLEANNIALEPDIIAFKTTINNDAKFILHILKDKIPVIRNKYEYEAAILLTELSAAALNACGSFENVVLNFSCIGNLEPYFTNRLNYLFQLLITNPPRLSKIIIKLKKLSQNNQMVFIDQIQETVLASYKTHYEAVAFLEKLYAALGFSEQELYSNIHNDNRSVKQSSNPESLDKEEINKLREDSRQISSVIENIFSKNDEHRIIIESDIKAKEHKAKTQENILSLDEEHSSMLIQLVKKEDWQRSEIEALAKKLSLFTDGAIETINEASYNKFDAPFIEENKTSYKIDIALYKQFAQNE